MVCQSTDDGDEMLICGDGNKGCDMGCAQTYKLERIRKCILTQTYQNCSLVHRYHIFCLDPPLTCVPGGDWFCQECRCKGEKAGETSSVNIGVSNSQSEYIGVSKNTSGWDSRITVRSRPYVRFCNVFPYKHIRTRAYIYSRVWDPVQ